MNVIGISNSVSKSNFLLSPVNAFVYLIGSLGHAVVVIAPFIQQVQCMEMEKEWTLDIEHRKTKSNEIKRTRCG